VPIELIFSSESAIFAGTSRLVFDFSIVMYIKTADFSGVSLVQAIPYNTVYSKKLACQQI